MSHPRDLLPAYAAGTLPPGSHRAVSAHVTGCRACMDELQAWRMVAQATRARSAAVAAPPPFAAIQARLRSASPVVAPYRGRVGERPLVRAARLLWRQPRLIGWPVWLVCGIVLAVGIGLAAVAPPGRGGQLLAETVPLAAALAVAGACGGGDPAAELVAASPTSVRAILLARLTVALGAVFLVAFGASGLLVGLHGGTAAGVLAFWLGPMVLLSAISFTMAVIWRPMPAVAVAVGLWAGKVMVGTGGLHPVVAYVFTALWTDSVLGMAAAAGLVVATVVLLPWLSSRPLPRYGPAGVR